MLVECLQSENKDWRTVFFFPNVILGFRAQTAVTNYKLDLKLVQILTDRAETIICYWKKRAVVGSVWIIHVNL